MMTPLRSLLTMASSEDSTIEASRWPAASARFCSLMSTSMLTAPVSVPAASRIGVGYGMNGTRVPSGRSRIASAPRIGRCSLSVVAIGHSSCRIGLPSAW